MDDLGVPLFLETPIKIQLVARDLFFSRLSHITATTVLVVWVAPLNHVFVSSDQRHVFLLQKRGWHPTQGIYVISYEISGSRNLHCFHVTRILLQRRPGRYLKERVSKRLVDLPFLD